MTIRIRYRQLDGSDEELKVAVGESIRNAALDEGIPGIEGECGGQLNCATCHVYVSDEWLRVMPDMDELEDAMLDATASPRTANSRLSCQLRVQPEWDGCVVDIPESQY
jgi:ferredoxin, 2Fe-2S